MATRSADGFHDEGYGFDTFGLHLPSLVGAVRAAAPVYERYFRVDSSGIEHVPEGGPAILVANHGGVLPIDAAVLCMDIVRRTERIPRAVTDHFVPRLPIASTLLARLGVVSGTRANVRRLLELGELIAIWPEGTSGPAKPFRDRYQIQRWSVGFAELAIRHRAPVIPVAIVGSEESWPLLGKLALPVLGAPYVPIPASPVPLPAHFHLRYGAALTLHDDPADADDPTVVATAAAMVREQLEQLLAGTLASRSGVWR